MSELAELYIGIEIGGTKLQLVVGDKNATIIDRIRYEVQANEGASHIREQVQDGLDQLLKRHSIKAIGVGFGGPIDWQTGAIQLSHQVGGWENINLKHWLNDFSGLPVAADNDANTAALGEAMIGQGKGIDNVFYITIGSGIGGGLVSNGAIYHGRVPGECEIGHLRLTKAGNKLEQSCSGWAVNKKVEEIIANEPGGILAKLAEQNRVPGALLLQPAIQKHDPQAFQLLHDIADDLAFALSHIVHLFNPGIIVIGGGLSLLGETLTKAITERMPQYVMKALHPIPPVVVAGLTEDAVPAGALLLATQAQLHTSPQKN
jgi:glucokinase